MSAQPVLPSRCIRLAVSDPEALVEVQPERKRRYHRISRSPFHATLNEASVAGAAILAERWSAGMRVSCDRPRGYRVFGVPVSSSGEAIWCGSTLAAGDLLRVDEPWEISTTGAFEYVAFAVDAAQLELVAARLNGGESPARAQGNLVLHAGETAPLVQRLRRLLAVLRDAESQPVAASLATAELLELAAKLDGRVSPTASRSLSPPSRRRAAVLRIEEYLAAHPGELPSIPTLCGLAGVSERTLEYAFREQIGMTAVRYLKLRRLNGVRRDLREARGDSGGVTEIALRWGFRDLGRFAGEYRSLFGELPSETLGGRPRRGRTASRTPERTDSGAPRPFASLAHAHQEESR